MSKTQENEDDLLKMICGTIMDDESSASTAVPEKEEQVKLLYDALCKIVDMSSAKITYELNSPYVSMGAVSIEGENIEITNPMLFSKLAQIASNLNVYPRVDNKVHMDFTFHNLTRKAGK